MVMQTGLVLKIFNTFHSTFQFFTKTEIATFSDIRFH